MGESLTDEFKRKWAQNKIWTKSNTEYAEMARTGRFSFDCFIRKMRKVLAIRSGRREEEI